MVVPLQNPPPMVRYEASHPASVTEMSLVKVTSIAPPELVIMPGNVLPENAPNNVAPVVVPLYTRTTSHPCSVAKLVKVNSIGCPFMG